MFLFSGLQMEQNKIKMSAMIFFPHFVSFV